MRRDDSHVGGATKPISEKEGSPNRAGTASRNRLSLSSRTRDAWIIGRRFMGARPSGGVPHMSTTITFIESPNGHRTVEGMAVTDLESRLGDNSEHVNCAKPVTGTAPLTPDADYGTIRVASIYHNSVVDGPGLRSVLQVQGVPIRCAGYYVPQTHDATGGTLMNGGVILQALLDPRFDRSGVTVLGGEPLAQAPALIPLLVALRAAGIHIRLYTGYTVERTRDKGTGAQRMMLLLADLVIDGPYIKKYGDQAGEWRGSSNQRILSREDVQRILTS